MSDLAFVLVNQLDYPSDEKVIASAKKLGITLTAVSGDAPLSFVIEGGGQLSAKLKPGPHQDLSTLPFGPTSPSPEECKAARGHFVLTAEGLEGTPRQRDTRMAALTTAVLIHCEAVGAMLGHGVVFHKARLFAELSALGVLEGELPVELAIDITASREEGERMSFLTHNMQRYGCENLYVTCPIRGTGALEFVLSLARWMLKNPEKELATGEAIGRSEDENVPVQRVPNPTGFGHPVIRIDLER